MTRPLPSLPSLLIRDAEVVDGSGKPRFEASVLLHGGLIEAVLRPGETHPGVRAAQVLDGRGCVLCPGFIDAHAHDDRLLLERGAANPKLAQGVTTVVIGNCGLSLAPLTDAPLPPPLDLFGADAPRFDSFAAYAAALDAAPLALNAVPLLGHTSLRLRHVAQLERAATAAETAQMRKALQAALAAGAFGLSTGVYYPPARAADGAELLGVASALAGAHAVLAMHVRDEADHLEAAVHEALDIGAACSARLVLSHHKAVGPANYGRTRHTLAAIDAAAATQSVCLDCYPYAASSTMLDPAKAERIGEVLVTGSGPHPEMAGRMLRDIAAAWNTGLADAARRLMPGGAVYFGLSADDVDRVLTHPLAMIGSDGLPHDAWPHPRLWGTFPRVLAHYCRERGLLPLEAAIHKMSGLPAQRFGLHGRGRIEPGCVADLVLLDPERVADRATYALPVSPPDGIRAVIVDGQLALSDGHATGLLAGRRLQPA